MKGRANRSPDVGVYAACARRLCASVASQVTKDAGVLKGLEAGRRSPVPTNKPNLWLGMELETCEQRGIR
jgi:hypothetical protein